MLSQLPPEPVIWRRHKRARRASVRIDPRFGQVIVTLPPRATRAEGAALLAKNAAWVRHSLESLPAMLCLADGAAVPIEGLRHTIRHRPGPPAAWLEHGCLHVSCEPDQVGIIALAFLREEAARRLGARAHAKAAKAHLHVQAVKVRDTVTRWGSCSPHGRLMFCWRLLMAPPFVQDYAVAHEVAHLRHLDHGAAFWALAEKLSPHRWQATAWLEREGPRLLRVR